MPDLDRRDFLKLVGASAGAAAATGCGDHVEKLIPYVVEPEEVVPGNALFYASTCTECPAACGLHVRVREGRPVKLEGNPDHPVNRGRLCARGQAGIGRTYHPDRFAGPRVRGSGGELEETDWDTAIAMVAGEIRKAPQKTWVLGGVTGPTRGDVIDAFVRAVGAGGRTVYEPFAQEALREASQTVFGVGSTPVFDLSRADLIVDFGSDFLETGPSPVEHAAQLAEARDVAAREHGGARLVSIGPRLSLTASNSDLWLAPKPGTEGILALALARVAIENGAGTDEHRALLGGLLSGFDAASAAAQADVAAEEIERAGKALAAAHAAVALPPGPALTSRRAIASTAAVLLLNHVLGAVGSRVIVPPAPAAPQPSHRDTLALIQAIEAGNVSVLLIHDADPVYSLPASAGFAEALSKVSLVVSFASAPDETTELAHLVLPDHTPLESWGDAEPRPGVRSLVQPTLRPLYDTRALGDSLLDVGRAVGDAPEAALPGGSFRSLVESAWSGGDFAAALQSGGRFDDAPAVPVALAAGLAGLEVMEPKLTGEGSHALVAFPHPFLYDGRGANLSWLQELPDNVSKIAWASWAEVSKATAVSLGVELGDVIAVETSAGSLELPVYVRGGLRDDVVAIPIGQGHTVGRFATRVRDWNTGEMRGEPRGVNVLDALAAGVDERGGRAFLTERATLSNTGRTRRLPMLQWSDNKRGRMLAETISLVALAEAGDDHHGEHGEGHGDGHVAHEILEPFDPAADAAADSSYRWGLSIDLDRCTGCSACVAACYVENNLPVVGEEETLKVRQMPWLRIERFVGEGEADLVPGRAHPTENRESLGDSDVRHSPMMCQHCGSAPCEPVCPVIATYHNEDGLNGMIYNRCIGTRYCANNCPYKVRRFNYFDNQLTKWPEPTRLMLNPDVTVRGQGVMEKCTFCVQRITDARQRAKSEGRAVRDNEVKTACQQSCPTEAIRFGNLRDPQGAVTSVLGGPRSYHALHSLNTRPAVTYLKKVDRGEVEG